MRRLVNPWGFLRQSPRRPPSLPAHCSGPAGPTTTILSMPQDFLIESPSAAQSPSDPAAPRPLQPGGSLLALAERTANIGSWSINLPGKRLRHSNEFAAILGVTAGTLMTLDEMLARYTPEWRESIGALMQDCGQTGTPFDEEMQVVVPGKVSKWVRTVGEVVRDERGRIIRMQGVLKDISARKQAQRETLRLAMRLTTTLASITEAFVTLDRRCCFTYLNQESERLLQRSTG